MATTTNYSWETPDDTDLVKDGAAAIRTLGSSVDTTTKALNPSTTLGDIEYRSATANTNTRLPIGTSGQVLAVSGGVPAWTTTSSGGMTLLSTTTLSGASTTISSIDQTYNNLQIIVRLWDPNDNSGRGFNIRFNSDSSTLYSTVAYSTGDVYDTSFGETSINTSNNTSSTNVKSLCVINIPDYANTSTWKQVNTLNVSAHYTNTNRFNLNPRNGIYGSTSGISEITLFPTSGNWDGGTVLIYGVK